MAEGSLRLVKRKRPPAFPHHPAARGQFNPLISLRDLTIFAAKKLKQDWVFNAKIKSKWKVEKRKMAAANPGDDKDTQDVDSDSSAPSNIQDSKDQSPFLVPPAPVSCTKSISQKVTTSEQTTSSRPSISVREMKRNAYSKASLHSYKADPLNKRKSGGQFSTRNRDRNGGRGKGQPDMKLRMNAMLEKIKRDLV
ncbi:uncharacterized protein BT62DRAFT_1070385 [Guyanagaster necrorhizus]|uniref:Uncharacterized protein n=1 Tax=Guyanagaster necrorhizus TaxID=856835 RepID=A0A9P7W642_9AGAR|nr:uncharacterized protein BT62DRAFT_1070385 [Guyanagaster necrorhizus MCA 3950]KAG7452640.1 hypothetical protein BT62DRAFT_1070385 [Guyanagaster necrorhizus MCA 3950]